MYNPTQLPWRKDESLVEYLEKTGVPRRDFLKFCGEMAVMLGLASAVTPRIAKALASIQRPPVIWLSLQECTGCVESILRSSTPSIGDLLLDTISLDFQENLMAAAGFAAEKALKSSMDANKGKYILVVTGSIPRNEGGMYTTIAGRTAEDHLKEAAAGAAAVVAVGACAHWGNVQAAKPNPTGAVGVRDIITDKPVVNIAGCPPIADVITATLVHVLTFGKIPELDREGRPKFAYGAKIHDQCPRRANYDAGQFVEKFDDAAAREGYCLYHVGCKGPETFSPCPIFMWNNKESWPIGAGHPCIGCTEPNFWDTMTPFYTRLPNTAGIPVERTADIVGGVLTAAAVGGIALHATATTASRMGKKQLPVHPQHGGSANGGSKNDTPTSN
jgi:hydrogenase small subunit